jgi:hypothetical protein
MLRQKKLSEIIVLKKICLLFFIAVEMIFAVEMVAELDVSKEKVMGQAKGSVNEKEVLRDKAVVAALKGDADVLLEIDYYYREYGDSVEVTATGYPAKYTNFRLKSQEPVSLLNINSMRMGESKVVEVTEIKTTAKTAVESENSKRLSGAYLSIKGQLTATYYFDEEGFNYGFNFGWGGFTKNLYIGGDANLTFDHSGYPSGAGIGFSLGARIPSPNDWFQAIAGGSFGLFGGDDYFSVGGPMMKLLFGKNNTWAEFSHRYLIDFFYGGAHQIMCGFTYAPSKR